MHRKKIQSEMKIYQKAHDKMFSMEPMTTSHPASFRMGIIYITEVKLCFTTHAPTE